jgi:hypothetical protein
MKALLFRFGLSHLMLTLGLGALLSLAPLSSQLAAQTVLQGYDPGRLPYVSRQRVLDGCGFSMGLDPALDYLVEHSVTKDGRPTIFHKFSTNFVGRVSPYWAKYAVPVDDLAFNALLSIWVDCRRNAKLKSLATFARFALKDPEKGHRWLTDTAEATLPGLGQVFYRLSTSRKKNSGTHRWVMVARTQSSTLVTIFIRINSNNPTLRQKKRFEPGEVVAITHPPTGETFYVQMKHATIQTSKQVFVRPRSFEEDVALMRQIFSTIR